MAGITPAIMGHHVKARRFAFHQLLRVDLSITRFIEFAEEVFPGKALVSSSPVAKGWYKLGGLPEVNYQMLLPSNHELRCEEGYVARVCKEKSDACSSFL